MVKGICSMTKKLSIIVPCYYEEETIPLFYEAVEKVKKELNGIELELVPFCIHFMHLHCIALFCIRLSLKGP